MIYQPHGEYRGSFPIQKVQGSPWVVVGETWAPGRALASLDIHLDADDPNHVFLGPEAWAGWPNARRLSDWHNARHRKSMRLRQVRMTEYTREDSARIYNEATASWAYFLSELIRQDPTSECQYGDLDWSPTTQVWRDGEKWVKVRPEDLGA